MQRKGLQKCFYLLRVFPGNIIIEVTGPNEEKIKALDLKAVSKILEICEKGSIDYHVFGPLEIT